MKRIFAAIAIAICLAAGSHAAEIWSEDFEGAVVDNSLRDLGSPWGGGAGSYHVLSNGDRFGSNNQYLRLNAFGTPWTFVNNVQPASGVATVSFDFFADSATRNDSFLRLAVSRATANAAFVDINSAEDSLLLGTNISEDNALRFDIVANVSGSSVTANNGHTIATDEVHVFVDGMLAHSEAVLANGAGNVDGFGLWINNGDTVDSPVDALFVDNFSYHDMAVVTVVPEPAAIALTCLGALFLLGAARRKRS